MMSAKELIIQKLEALDVCIVDSDELEYTVRCPYCGDSDNPNHAHLGIYIDLDTDDPMIWNCLKCGEGGRLTETLLEDLGIELDASEADILKKYDQKMAKLAMSRNSIIQSMRYKVPPEIAHAHEQRKLDYIEGRIGHKLPISEHKIVTSLREFLAFNEIEKLKGLPDWVQAQLEMDYVGFLSANNNQISFRRMTDNEKQPRWFKVTLNPYLDDKGSFYSIPTQLDLLYTGVLHLHIAEGIFDILSVKYNLPELEGKNIYYAACGYSYLNILRYLARSGIITDLDAHIYADKDKSDRDHMKIIKPEPCRAFFQHFTLHRNGMKGEKDYGVLREKIQDTKRKVW